MRRQIESEGIKMRLFESAMGGYGLFKGSRLMKRFGTAHEAVMFCMRRNIVIVNIDEVL
jgi:hypothetical protein